jgi:lipoate-protein ligase B
LYIRALEQALIEFLCEMWKLPARRNQGRTGVWVLAEDGQLRKIASIGIHVRRWVTSHGFALNLATDLSMFRKIVPCGIRDAEMTSVACELRDCGRTAEAQLLNQSHALKRIAELFHPYLVAQFQAGGWLPNVNADA